MRKYNVSKWFLFLVSISIVGWLWETIYVSILIKEYAHRGFLTLPICPIYGTGILLIYLTLGIPQRPKGMLKKMKNKYLNYILYFFLAGIIPSALELVVGYSYEKLSGKKLWTYEHHPYNLGGYISLQMVFIWAFVISLFMYFLFDKMKRWFLKLPNKQSFILSIIVLVFISLDFILKFVDFL